MRKSQIHFSNNLREIATVLKQNLFPAGSGPFEKRLIVVPHMNLKSFLLQNLAKDPQLGVAAGLQIVSLPQAYTKITKKPIPSKMELSLFLQHALAQMIDEEPDLKQYFGSSAREERMGPFCDELAKYFQRYALYGKGPLSAWQERLFDKLAWVFPQSYKGKAADWQIHLFGFTFVPKCYFDFFQKQGAQFYLFSPCGIFWGDFYSDREQAFLEKSVPESQRELFSESFEDQNPLLSNWGKIGRMMQIQAEESELPSTEHFIETEGQNALQLMQNAFLMGNAEKPKADNSIRIFSAATRLREVEILKDQLLQMFDEEGIVPHDVQVFAPDINLYAPYIQAVFEDISFSLSDLDFESVDPIFKAFKCLINLPKSRFELNDVLRLISQMKFDLDVSKIRRWLNAAGVRWGFSKAQRSQLYLQDMEASQMSAATDQGTWEHGFKRLILGLGEIGGQALCVISSTEMEEFDRLYLLMHNLADDLSPLFDGTTWTIPTWLRYLGCLLESYFDIDPSHDLYKELLELAGSSDHLDKQEIPFSGIERVLTQRRGKSKQAPHLAAIRFGSFSEGCIEPSQVVCLLGMDEDAFPRKEENSSLYAGEIDPRPKQTEIDRYLFLQAIISAEKTFLTSYLRDQDGKGGVSLLVEELMGQIEDLRIIHHPAESCDVKYFQGAHVCYNQAQYKIAKAKLHPKGQEPLIRSFYERVDLSLDADKFLESDPIEIDLKKLFKFARHPLRYYFHEVLGLYPERDQTDERDYLLDYFSKSDLVKFALQTSLEEAFKKAEIESLFPLNLTKPLAKEQIKKELDIWKEAIKAFGIEEMNSKKIEMQVGRYLLKGSVDFFTDKGLLVRAEESLEDKIRFYPQALIMQKHDLPLLFAKDHSFPSVEGSLETYLDYFMQAHKHPSPMQPNFAKALLVGESEDLKKALKQVDDEIWAYLLLRDPLPQADRVHSNWNPLLRATFGASFAQV